MTVKRTKSHAAVETVAHVGLYSDYCQDALGIIKRVGQLAEENGVSIHAILQVNVVKLLYAVRCCCCYAPRLCSHHVFYSRPGILRLSFDHPSYFCLFYLSAARSCLHIQNPITDRSNVDFVVTSEPCRLSQVSLLSVVPIYQPALRECKPYASAICQTLVWYEHVNLYV